MRLNTIEQLDEELAKTLIGKHIQFTLHNNKDKTFETMPGKVLYYHDGKIEIDTMDIIMLDNNIIDNKMIKIFNIKDITDIFVFEKYNKNFYKLLDELREDLKNKVFQIITVFEDNITTEILDYDSLFITIKLNGKKYDYPLYFIKSLKKVTSKKIKVKKGESYENEQYI